MFAACALFIIPTLLFVIAFLYETYLSFRRVLRPKLSDRRNYLSATWEFTHTLLVFAVVMLVMLFTQTIDQLASAIFISTFMAATALGVRAVLYIYIFYARKKKVTNWVDWLFAFSHLVTALLLVTTVCKALWYLYKNNPPVNSQFVPTFLIAMPVILVLCLVPAFVLYRTKN